MRKLRIMRLHTRYRRSQMPPGGVIAVGIEDNGDVTGITEERENRLRQIPHDFLKPIILPIWNNAP